MSESAAPAKRLDYLEGLRGIACVQVVLCHFNLIFMPQVRPASPLRHLLTDGGMAVAIFFLLSGTVLTFAYARVPLAVPSGLARRVVRLGVPLAAACLCALTLHAACDAFLQSRAASMPPRWQLHQTPITVSGALLDATARVVTGYADTSLVPAAARSVPKVVASVDGPIWSLHLELWGSIMMLLLVAGVKLVPRLHWPLVATLLALCGPVPLALFIPGYLFAKLARGPAASPVLGTGFLLAGLAVGAAHAVPGLYQLTRLAGRVALLHGTPWDSTYSMVAAILVYTGVLLTPAARTALGTGAVRRIGRLSFSIYLLHEPVMLTAGAAAFVFGGITGAGLATVGVTTGLAILFERLVDRQAIALSRHIVV